MVKKLVTTTVVKEVLSPLPKAKLNPRHRIKVKAEDNYDDPLKKKQARAGRLAVNRGKTAERVVVKIIGKWFDPEGKFEWSRTPNSGGSPLKTGHDLSGDMTTTCKDFPFHIEIKKDKRWEKMDGAFSTEWIVWTFVRQAMDDCPRHRYPLIIFMMPGFSQHKYIGLWQGVPPEFYLQLMKFGLTYIHVTRGVGVPANLILMRLLDFVKIPPEVATKLFKINPVQI